MAGSGTLTVRVLADTNDFKKGIDDVDAKVSGFGGKMKGAALGIGAAVGGAFAVDALIGFGADLLDLGTSVETWRMKAKTVFEGSAGDVTAWADKNNEAMGLTDDKLLGLAASFGDLLKPMGFTAEQAADMSTKTLELSGALAAWSGGQKSAAEVSEILSAAMLGETDSLKSLGISISAADIEQRLMEKGQKDLTGAARQQAEALATQELIMEKSTDAQKAWTDGSMDATKRSNELKAKFQEIKETLAEKLLPIAQKFTSWLVDSAIPFVEDMVEALTPWVEAIIEVATAIGETLAEAFIAMAKIVLPIIQTLVDTWLGAAEFIVKAGASAFGWVPGVGDKLKDAAGKIEGFRDDTNAFLDGIREKVINVGANTGGAEGQLVKVKSMLDQIQNKTVTVRVVESLVRQEDAQARNRSGLARRALGGPVTAGTPYMVGERGPEMFVPLRSGDIVPNHRLGSDRTGGAGVTNHFTINQQPGQSPEDLVRLIVEYERRNGAGWRAA